MRFAAVGAIVALAVSAVGCRTPGAAPRDSAFDPHVGRGLLFPDVADHIASDLAAAALVSDREGAMEAQHKLENIDTVLLANDELPTGLSPVSRDLVNTTLDDPTNYRKATRDLLRDDDLGRALRSRLELVAADDPLLLARARMRDSYVITFGRAFNAVAEPVGTSVTNWSAAPYKLARSLLAYGAAVYTDDPLPLQERQALNHWKDFLNRNPGAPEAPSLEMRVNTAESEWLLTQRNKTLRTAEKALGHGQFRLALVYADRALRYVPEDARASELRDIAAEGLQRQRSNRMSSVSSEPRSDVAPPQALPLAKALLLPDGDIITAANELMAEDPEGALTDEALFSLALARREAGAEDAMWDLVEEVAGSDGTATNMARHAATLYRNPQENAHNAFEAALRRNVLDNVMWVLVGPYYRGVPDRGLPRPLAWVMDMPAVAESVTGSPVRLLQLPWVKALPAAKQAAHYGRLYLERHPDGEHAVEVSRWLEGFEKKRGNRVGAYRIAEGRPGVTVQELDEYREKAAKQALATARRAGRRDLRLSTLRSVAQEFADTEAGRRAGLDIRDELSGASPHTIRISRGFLLENPEVAGPAGVGLRAELLDDDAANGELHPQGMTLLGGGKVAFHYLGPSGDGDDPPLVTYESVDEERLARIVSALEEASFENSLLDDDDVLTPDAQRDVFFERARLGLATESDMRSTASAEYAYRGMRERYGIIRGRESVLPFDLVFKGSLNTMSFGAFPRIREPRQTPDAILYK